MALRVSPASAPMVVKCLVLSLLNWNPRLMLCVTVGFSEGLLIHVAKGLEVLSWGMSDERLGRVTFML